MPTSKRWVARVLGVTAIAVWVMVWPHDYGLQAHSIWLRLGAALVLVFQAMFVGVGAALIIMRPLLTMWGRPFPSASTVFKGLVDVARGKDAFDE